MKKTSFQKALEDQPKEISVTNKTYLLTETQLKQLKVFFLEQKAKDAIPYLNMLGNLPTVEKDDGKQEE